MRILHVVPTYYPATRYGGPIVSVHELCAALAKRGHDVDVFTTNVDGPANSDVPIGAPVSLSGVNVWYFRVPFFRRVFWSPQLRRALEKQIERFDVVHTHSVFLWPTWAAARAAFAQGVPYVVSPRGMLVQELIRRKSSLAKKAWISLIEKGNLERADAIHVTSAAEAAGLGSFPIAFPPLQVVPNGVTVTSAESADGQGLPESLRVLLQSPDPVLLCLGRITWKKGLDRAIRALALVPSVRLLVVGHDEDNHAESLMTLAARLGVRDRVHVFGPVFGKAKAELYRRATLFILPSHSENFGNVVLEAMAEGCPVIVSPEVGAATIVQEIGGGKVIECEPATLAQEISTLLADPLRRQEMGRNAREAIARNYSWDAVAARMEDVYEGAIAHHRAKDTT